MNVGKKTKQSEKVYNDMAWEYDSSPEGNYTRSHKEEIIKKAVLREGDNILDVACGNGYLLGELSKKAGVNAFGVDISENMIASARERYPACTFAVGSCTPLGFENESMDVITVSCAFHHFETPQIFVNECMRVLKKNGKVVIVEPFFTPVVRWLANTVVFPFTKTGDVKVYSQKELQSFFKVAGFTTVESYITGAVLFYSARK
ncbi:MAG: methyltransferase domain-containing protein [Lachnospiraceae bacterium]|nr:methyltransferase domain-containing protein [Lachnospiraceae bacterium]